MAYPISVAQQIHRENNPVSNHDAILEDLLILIGERNGSLAEAIQHLINSTPSIEVHYGANPPDNPDEGDLWYHPDENRLYAYVKQ